MTDDAAQHAQVGSPDFHRQPTAAFSPARGGQPITRGAN
jgi:hypothetical protein